MRTVHASACLELIGWLSGDKPMKTFDPKIHCGNPNLSCPNILYVGRQILRNKHCRLFQQISGHDSSAWSNKPHHTCYEKYLGRV